MSNGVDKSFFGLAIVNDKGEVNTSNFDIRGPFNSEAELNEAKMNLQRQRIVERRYTGLISASTASDARNQVQALTFNDWSMF